MQHYVLVNMRRQLIEVYTRGADRSWTLQTHGPGDEVYLPGINARVPVSAFYADVDIQVGV